MDVAPPARAGSGSKLPARWIARELAGEIAVDFRKQGLTCGTEFLPGGTVVTGNRLNVLVVEDETLIAMELEDILEDLGHIVVGVAATPTRALELIADVDDGIDAVLLDANLGGLSSLSVAKRLSARGIPFLLTTGYSREELLRRGLDAPCIAKPYNLDDVRRALDDLARA